MAARRRNAGSRYPPIAGYAYISDCHSAALIGREASIDWCCMPRLDAASVFGRLLDWEKGGHFSLQPSARGSSAERTYVGDSMVLRTTFTCDGGSASVTDCLVMRRGGRRAPHRQLLRVVDGLQGRVPMEARIVPRFDYGELKPWIVRRGACETAAIGGDGALLLSSDAELEMGGDHDVVASFSIRAGERVRFSVQWVAPELVDAAGAPSAEECDGRLADTLDWWAGWVEGARVEGRDAGAVRRSVLVLRALVNAPTGAIAAAPTTSLPESDGGSRNWDYRFSWIRDSSFSVRSLADVGCDREADGFRRFIQRSAAGSAHDLQVMYGLGGERRLTEITLEHLEGYRGSRPVRIGNGASKQLQLDTYGELVLLSWRWHRRGQAPDDDYWRFLLDLVDVAIERWEEPDRGIWEIRGRPAHFVHSKVMCWAAVDRGLALAQDSLRQAPLARWRRAARRMRREIEANGYDERRGVFTQAFDRPVMDASLLLLPASGFVEWTDPRMVRTVDRVREELERDGLLLRYHPASTDDGLEGGEGAFIACTFWLAECLARQGRRPEARAAFDRAAGTANDLGLFSEEFDGAAGVMLGNFPQGLTHLSHIAAARALADLERSDA